MLLLLFCLFHLSYLGDFFYYCLQLTLTFVSIYLELIWISCDWLISTKYTPTHQPTDTHTPKADSGWLEKIDLSQTFLSSQISRLINQLRCLHARTHARKQQQEEIPIGTQRGEQIVVKWDTILSRPQHRLAGVFWVCIWALTLASHPLALSLSFSACSSCSHASTLSLGHLLVSTHIWHTNKVVNKLLNESKIVFNKLSEKLALTRTPAIYISWSTKHTRLHTICKQICRFCSFCYCNE